MTNAELTAEQQRVLTFVVDYQRNSGFPPTVREIAAALGYKSPNNVRQHLRLIAQKGHLKRMSGKARGIEISSLNPAEDYSNSNESNGVPIIGAVAAGLPITAVENVEGYLTLDRTIFRGDGLFALRVKGDSMNGIGILNGDIAVIRKQQHANNEEVVVVLIDGDATLKRFIKDGDEVRLHAENPKYKDIQLEPTSSIQVAGKLVGVVRKY